MKKLSRIITLMLAVCCMAIFFTACNKDKEHEKIIAEYAKLKNVDESSVGFACCGEFGGTHVFIDLYGVHNQVITPETVDGVTFYHPVQMRFYVYNNGNFYRLQEAFDNGLLTHDNLLTLRDIYNPQ